MRALLLLLVIAGGAAMAGNATDPAAPPAAGGDVRENPLGLQAHHVTAEVGDLERAMAWYQAMLGFRVRARGSHGGGAVQFAELGIPGFGVALVQVGVARAAPSLPTPSATQVPPPGAPHWVHIVFSVADPAATFALLKARGAQAWTRAAAGEPLTSFLVNDSEGNEIEIVAADAH